MRAGFSVEFASPLGGFTTVSTSSIDLSDPDNKGKISCVNLQGNSNNLT